MGNVPERWAAFEAREGMLEVGAMTIRQVRRALGRSLGTMDQAVRVFDAVAAQGGWLDPAGGDAQRAVYVRDREHRDWLVPVPVVEHGWHPVAVFELGGAEGLPVDTLLPADAPEGWKPGDPHWDPAEPPPDILPRGPTMRSGSLRIAEGGAILVLEYDDRGRMRTWQDSNGDTYTERRFAGTRAYSIDPLAQPPMPKPLGLLLRGDLDVRGQGAPELARMIGELDPGAAVVGRVRMPVPHPDGARAAFTVALQAMRRALYRGRVPDEARWLAADGLDGSVVAWGTARGEALARFAAEVEVRPPSPPRPAEPSNVVPFPPPLPREPGEIRDADGKLRGISLGTFTISPPPRPQLVPWPAGTLAEVPVALVPIAPPPPPSDARWREAGFARWEATLDDRGATSHMLVREDSDGWTAIGAGILDLVEPGEIDDQIAAALARELELVGDPAMLALLRVGLRDFRVVDDLGRARAPFRAGNGSSGAVDGAALDGARMGWTVSRMRDR